MPEIKLDQLPATADDARADIDELIFDPNEDIEEDRPEPADIDEIVPSKD